MKYLPTGAIQNSRVNSSSSFQGNTPLHFHPLMLEQYSKQGETRPIHKILYINKISKLLGDYQSETSDS